MSRTQRDHFNHTVPNVYVTEMKTHSTRTLSVLAALTLGSTAAFAQTLYVPGTVQSSSTSNVGIGTSSPGVPLEVAGQIMANVAGGGSLALKGSNSNSQPIIYFERGAGAVWLAGLTNDASASFFFNNGYGGGNVMTLAPSGNVGVGTTSPSSKLQLEKTASDTVSLANASVFFADTALGAGLLGQQKLTSPYAFVLQAQNQTNNAFFPISLNPGGGNVGIGTTTPNAKLEVAGYQRIYAPISGSILDVMNSDGNDGSGLYIKAGGVNSGKFALAIQSAAGADIMRVLADGNVGIGATNPLSKLQLEKTASDTVSLANSSIFFADTALGAGLLGQQKLTSPYAFVLQAQNQTNNAFFPISLNPSGGNVGIGTTSPSHKLAVNGTIRAKEVIVDTGWSDHVFADDYRLAPLSEVESHIKAEKHLPGIPSAKEVAEHGVSMGDMQSKLLAKVEELTLHLIAQEKRQFAQEKQLHDLKKENADLQEKIHALQPSAATTPFAAKAPFASFAK